MQIHNLHYVSSSYIKRMCSMNYITVHSHNMLYFNKLAGLAARGTQRQETIRVRSASALPSLLDICIICMCVFQDHSSSRRCSSRSGVSPSCHRLQVGHGGVVFGVVHDGAQSVQSLHGDGQRAHHLAAVPHLHH